MTEIFFKTIKEFDSGFANQLITAIEKGFTVTVVSGEETENYRDRFLQPYMNLSQLLMQCWKEIIEQDENITREMKAEDVIIHYLQQHHTKDSAGEEV